MLTKEERKAIAERANECVEVCGSFYVDYRLFYSNFHNNSRFNQI